MLGDDAQQWLGALFSPRAAGFGTAFALRQPPCIGHSLRDRRTESRLCERILAGFDEHPDRVTFPVSRTR